MNVIPPSIASIGASTQPGAIAPVKPDSCPTEFANQLGTGESKPAELRGVNRACGSDVAANIDNIVDQGRSLNRRITQCQTDLKAQSAALDKTFSHLPEAQRAEFKSMLNDNTHSLELLSIQREMQQLAMVTELASKTIEMASGTVSRVSQMQT
jgi:hypothetical protein